MLELCPQGHEEKHLLHASFSLLGEDDPQNVRALAKKADALWSLHGMKT
jgi:hypothetical protein